jgi:hypothetical protein
MPDQKALPNLRHRIFSYEFPQFSQLVISDLEPSDMIAPPLTFVDVTTGCDHSLIKWALRDLDDLRRSDDLDDILR